MNGFGRAVVVVLVVLFASGLGVGLGSGPAAACSCAPSTVEERAADVAFAFTGRQTGRRVIDEVADNGAVLTFAVSQVFKGEVAETVSVRTHAQSSACGLDLSAAGEVAVAAFVWRGEPQVNLCGSIVEAEELVAVFGQGRPPAPDGGGEVDRSDGERALEGSDWEGPTLRFAVVAAVVGIALIVLVTTVAIVLSPAGRASRVGRRS